MGAARNMELKVALVILVLSPCKSNPDLEFLYTKDNDEDALVGDRKDIDDMIKNEISANDSSVQDDEDIGAALQKLVRTAAILPVKTPNDTARARIKAVSPSTKVLPVDPPAEPLEHTQSLEQSAEQEGQNNTVHAQNKTTPAPSKVAVVVVLSSCAAESLLNKSTTSVRAQEQLAQSRLPVPSRDTTAFPEYAPTQAVGSIQYADSREAPESDDRPGAGRTYYQAPKPRVAKVSDLLTDQQIPFRRVIANQLNAPVSAYQRVESPMYTGLAQNPSQQAAFENTAQFQGLPAGFNNYNSPGSVGGLGDLKGIPSGDSNFNPYTSMQQNAGSDQAALFAQIVQQMQQQMNQQQPSQMDAYTHTQNQVETAKKIQDIMATSQGFQRQMRMPLSPSQFPDYRQTNQPPDYIVNALPPSLKEAYARQGSQSIVTKPQQDKSMMTLNQVLSGNELQRIPSINARQSSQSVDSYNQGQFKELRQRSSIPDLAAIQVYSNKSPGDGVFSAKDMEPNPVQKIELQQYPHPKLGVEILSPNSLPMLQNPSIYNPNANNQFPQIVQNNPPFYAQNQPFAPMGPDFNVQFPPPAPPPNYAQPNFGQSSFGQPSFGQPSFGQPSFGQPNFAQPNFGQANFGQPTLGQLNYPMPGAGGPSNVQYYGDQNAFGGK